MQGEYHCCILFSDSDVVEQSKIEIDIQQTDSTPAETTNTNDTPPNTNDVAPSDTTTEQDTKETTSTGEGNNQDTPMPPIASETTPTNLESTAEEEEALSSSQSSERIAPIGQGNVDNSSWLVIDSETGQQNTEADQLLLGEPRDTAAAEDTSTDTGTGIPPQQDTEVQTVVDSDPMHESRTEGVASC